MTAFDARPKVPILRRHGFLLRGDEFGVEDEPRVDGARLVELFHPYRVKRQADTEAEAKRLFKKSFLAAQLRYYGIKFNPAAAKAELHDQLKDAVDVGECKRVPVDIVRLEKQMQGDYENMFKVWEKKAAKWDEEHKDRPAPTVKSPRAKTRGRPVKSVAKAVAAPSLAKRRGRPPKNPTSSATTNLDVAPTQKRRGRPPKSASTVTAATDTPAKRRGRPPKDVTASAAKTANAKTATPGRRGRPPKIAATPTKTDPLKKRDGPGVSTSGKTPRPLELRQCRGSYAIKCDAIAEGWDDMDDLTLDICDGSGDGTLRAAMDFGVVEGTMILSPSDPVSVDDESVEDKEDEEDEDGEGSYQGLGKRKTALSRGPGRSKKHAKPIPPPSRRLTFHWRGRETSEGEIHHVPQAGFIEFNDSCTAITGEIDISFIGDSVEFSGHKVSKTPNNQPEDWSAFSEEANEEDREGRRK